MLRLICRRAVLLALLAPGCARPPLYDQNAFVTASRTLPAAWRLKDGGALEVRILDARAQQPLKGARLDLILGDGRELGSPRYAAAPDDHGIVRLGDLRPGAYTVEARLMGYRYEWRRVKVSSADTTNVTFALSRIDRECKGLDCY